MKLNQFMQFKAVAECENISQATLTKSIQRFEKQLGSQLFDRVGKRITLNDKGRLGLEASSV